MEKLIKILAVLLILILDIGGVSYAQSKTATALKYRNEVGIDIASILTFLSKKSDSYSVYYKRCITEKNTLRTGISMDVGSASDDRISFKCKLGYQRNYPVQNKNWNLFSALDASAYYSGSNYQSNKVMRLGITPVIGVNYYLSPCFTLSSEVGLNLFYTLNRKNNSVDSNDFEANIGSVGLIIVSYHF